MYVYVCVHAHVHVCVLSVRNVIPPKDLLLLEALAAYFTELNKV